jgi:4a-hydroxytetrahydrobiopterin dehydratase
MQTLESRQREKHPSSLSAVLACAWAAISSSRWARIIAFAFAARSIGSGRPKSMSEILAEKTCTPCRGGVPPLTRDEAQRFQTLAPDWELSDDAHRIQRSFRFRNFREALAFVQEVGELAETEGHHPDISFGWGYATVSLSTKKIKGLHENDFIMASKINRVLDRSGRPLDRQS